MSIRTPTERLRAIQRVVGVEPDGLLGPATLTALERALGLAPEPIVAKAEAARTGLRLSREGVDAIIRHEIGSDYYYNRHLRAPIWPGGDSGVTIGIGYDLGYQSEADFRAHWGDELPDGSLARLAAVCGKTGESARREIPKLRDISISLTRARRVFMKTSLPLYARKTHSAYPGIAELHPDAQSALVSLVYNRGTSMRNTDSRREMRELRDHVRTRDYGAMERALRSMKRLWAGRNLDGLLKRRDEEADMIARAASGAVDDGEVVMV
ncbi:MAG: hypothetical protein V2I82_11575 [Halieaceae bacterium]|nr:hypothetical protein [Halieaceae bacterium]